MSLINKLFVYFLIICYPIRFDVNTDYELYKIARIALVNVFTFTSKLDFAWAMRCFIDLFSFQIGRYTQGAYY